MSNEQEFEEKFSSLTTNEFQTFKRKLKEEYERIRDTTDDNNYVVILFQNHKQLYQFIDALGILGEDCFMDDEEGWGHRWIDGIKLAEKINLKLEKINLKPIQKFQLSKDITDDMIL